MKYRGRLIGNMMGFDTVIEETALYDTHQEAHDAAQALLWQDPPSERGDAYTDVVEEGE